MTEVQITTDAGNRNNRRIHVGGAQWCKVYGWNPTDAELKAKTIADALLAAPVEVPALPLPSYVMSEPHLSGHRVVLGYETMADAMSAHTALVKRTTPVEGDEANHDCLAKRRPGEPMFITLGRDPDGAHMVRQWAERRLAAGGDPAHCQMAFDTAARMEVYAADPENRPASAPPADAYPPMVAPPPEGARAEMWMQAHPEPERTEKVVQDAYAYMAGVSSLDGKLPEPAYLVQRLNSRLVRIAKHIKRLADGKPAALTGEGE